MFLALYSITDKQKYIFASPKLRDNIGASILIDSTFSKFLPDLLSESFNGQDLKNFNFFQNDYSDLFDDNGMFNSKYDLGLLFYGGGNALMYFKDEDIFRQFNKKFTKKVFDETNGGINLVFAIKEYDTSVGYMENYNRLVQELSFVKKSSTPAYPALGQGITRFSIRDGLPVGKKDKHGEELSFISSKKEEAFDNDELLKNYFGELIVKKLKIKEIKDFDALLDKDNRLGVIHIDGNNMGKQIKQLLENKKEKGDDTPKSIISTLKSLSNKIATLYKDTFMEMAEKFKSYDISIRPIVLAGDDVTYVISGKYAIYSAKEFLRILNENYEQNIGFFKDFNFDVSACAGVAIVNKHYPFYRAYELAESLCGSAKKRAKKISSESPGNWIDFQLLITSYIKDLESIREEFYEISHIDGYKLYLRPYCVDGSSEIFDFSIFEKIYSEFSDGKTWPRSKVKELRNLFIDRPVSLKEFLTHCKMRGLNLPKIEVASNGFIEYGGEKFTPYFDAIEMLDYYEKPKKKEENSEN